MDESTEQYVRRVMDGSDRSLRGRLLRGATAAAEPVYSAAMRVRNRMYDARIFTAHALGRWTISVGNITTGGTGKTPVVRWLAERLAAEGRRPAILLRGYKSTRSGLSDEAAMLADALRHAPGGPVPVIANKDRVAGAMQALKEHPRLTTFMLDDAMQHRRARRDVELVLINARDPFGYNRVFPRGLLREPLAGLGRANAMLITHAGEIAPADLNAIESTLRRHNSAAPIFRADHVIETVRGPAGQQVPLAEFCRTPFFAFCGIGNPQSFFTRLNEAGYQCTGTKAFNDHHAYNAGELERLQSAARQQGTARLLTSEKDWAKISCLAGEPADCSTLPVFHTELTLRFWREDEQQLYDQTCKSE